MASKQSTNSHDDSIIIEVEDSPAATTRKSTRNSRLQAEDSSSSLKLCEFPVGQKDTVTVSSQDYATLEHDTFLNDIIIDFYLTHLFYNVLPSESKDSVHIFSTMFYKRLLQAPKKDAKKVAAFETDPSLSKEERQHLRVAGWTKNVDLFNKDFVIIPICENSHWYLVVVVKPGIVNVAGEKKDSPAESQKGRDTLVDSEKRKDILVESEERTDSSVDSEKRKDILEESEKSTDSFVESEKRTDYSVDSEKRKDILVESEKRTDTSLESEKKTDCDEKTDTSNYKDAERNTENQVDSKERTDNTENSEEKTDITDDLQEKTDILANSEFLQPDLPDLSHWFTMEEVGKKRAAIAVLIRRLAKQQVKGGVSPNFPDI